MTLVLRKIFSREFPLFFCQKIWGRAYIIFLDEKIKTFPKNVFIFNDGIASNYRNPKLFKEINAIFLNKSQKNKKFFKNFYEKSLKKYRKLEQVWSKRRVDKKELIRFSNLFIDFWPSIYASMYVPADSKFKKSERDLMIKLRGKIDVAAAAACNLISRSLKDPIKNKKIILLDDRVVSQKSFSQIQKKYNFFLEEIKATGKGYVKGQVAFRGEAIGRVHIIEKKEQIKLFKQKEILVSSMTLPDFLPAMKKAAGFVTDEGGITSHAAIVAREMKKPCVIGTKIATKIFKDGDLVEVDAERGIVRKVKSRK